MGSGGNNAGGNFKICTFFPSITKQLIQGDYDKLGMQEPNKVRILVEKFLQQKFQSLTEK